MSETLLVLEEGARNRLCWRLAMIAQLLIEATNGDDSKKTLVSPLWGSQRRAMLRVAGEGFEIDKVAMFALERPMSEWLADGPEDSLLVGKPGEMSWTLSRYAYRLCDGPVVPRLFLGSSGKVLQGKCASLAVNWSSSKAPSLETSVWSELSRAWRRREISPPAESMVELLVIPVSWWLAGGVEASLLYERSEGFVATPIAREMADGILSKVPG